MNQSERRTILIQVLLKERPEYRGLRIPADADTQWHGESGTTGDNSGTTGSDEMPEWLRP